MLFLCYSMLFFVGSMSFYDILCFYMILYIGSMLFYVILCYSMLFYVDSMLVYVLSMLFQVILFCLYAIIC